MITIMNDIDILQSHLIADGQKCAKAVKDGEYNMSPPLSFALERPCENPSFILNQEERDYWMLGYLLGKLDLVVVINPP